MGELSGGGMPEIEVQQETGGNRPEVVPISLHCSILRIEGKLDVGQNKRILQQPIL